MMPKRSTITVSQNANGQYQETIPKPIRDGLALTGEAIEWDIISSTKLAPEKVDE